MDDFQSWPFPLLKPEDRWTEHDRDLLGFLKMAHEEGYQPRLKLSETEIEAGDSSIRSVLLVSRGTRNGWEPWLIDRGKSVRLGPSYGLDETACVCVRPPFRATGRLAMAWLRGRSLESVLSDFEFTGGRPEGIVLRNGGHVVLQESVSRVL